MAKGVQDDQWGRRFWAKVRVAPSGCWEWMGSRVNRRYGRVRFRGRQIFTHRLAYELVKGPVPDGLFVRHTCDNPPCVNPAHLLAGTHAENEADKWARNRTWLQGRKGTTNHEARLTDADVMAIRSAYQAGRTQRDLARQYGVAFQHIGRIVRRERWAHL